MRRPICYTIMTVLNFAIHIIFIFCFFRNSYIQSSDGEAYRELLNWTMRLLIVVLNIIIALQLVPELSKKFRLLLGILSGIGVQVFSYVMHRIFDNTILHSDNSTIIAFIFTEYILMIIAMEISVRIKIKMQLKNEDINQEIT